MRIIFSLLIAGLTCCSAALAGAAAPVINHITPASVAAGKAVVISGSGFGAPRKSATVVADYGNGFFYLLKPSSWSARTIVVEVPDLGKGLQPVLQVNAESGSSNLRVLHLLPRMVIEKSPVYEHRLKVGEKGEDVFEMKRSALGCGQSGAMFIEAGVHVDERRFADAQLIAAPESHCRSCEPFTVRWYNEPTGFIQYHIEVKKRLIEGICPAQRLRIHKNSVP